MIGLDTNILVRYLAGDAPVQSPRAAQIIEHQLAEEEPGFVSLGTMAETVWVLDRRYDATPMEIARYVERLLQTDTLYIQNEQEVYIAMTALKAGVASFADALIGALGAWIGCSRTLTFDRKAARLKEFQYA